MTMKKRFLGLALATAIALPATTAYANTTTIQGPDTRPLTQNVIVSGSVSNKQGVAPDGKIEVELPTTLAFSVDKNGGLQGSNYQVTNNSKKSVVVSVQSFTDTTPTQNIIVKPISEINESLTRANVGLSLVGRPVLGGDTTEIDLSSISSGGDDILQVDGGGSTGVIALKGIAGTQADADGVDRNGVSDQFNLVFNVRASDISK